MAGSDDDCSDSQDFREVGLVLHQCRPKLRQNRCTLCTSAGLLRIGVEPGCFIADPTVAL